MRYTSSKALETIDQMGNIKMMLGRAITFPERSRQDTPRRRGLGAHVSGWRQVSGPPSGAGGAGPRAAHAAVRRCVHCSWEEGKEGMTETENPLRVSRDFQKPPRPAL